MKDLFEQLLNGKIGDGRGGVAKQMDRLHTNTLKVRTKLGPGQYDRARECEMRLLAHDLSSFTFICKSDEIANVTNILLFGCTSTTDNRQSHQLPPPRPRLPNK